MTSIYLVVFSFPFFCICMYIYMYMSIQVALVIKNLPANAGDTGD